MSPRLRQPGFTLVEILIALTIGLFLIAGMLQMYVSNKQSFRFSEALARIQENGRYALGLIARDMRMADFWGCSRGNDITVHLNPGVCATPDATSTNAIVAGEGGAGGPGMPDQPDSITLRGSVGTSLSVAAGTTASVLNVSATVGEARRLLGDPDDNTGDIAFISNCRGGDLFQVTDLTGGSPTVVAFATGTGTPPGPPGNATSILSSVYDQSATVHSWREVLYSIQQGQDGNNALFFQENACSGGVARELLEGVENMQIGYGEDVDGDGTVDRYVPGANVTDMDAVVSVRVNLLLASAENNLVDQPQRITFDDYDGDDTDDTFTAPDRRLYQVVTATFAVRNRSL